MKEATQESRLRELAEAILRKDEAIKLEKDIRDDAERQIVEILAEMNARSVSVDVAADASLFVFLTHTHRGPSVAVHRSQRIPLIAIHGSKSRSNGS